MLFSKKFKIIARIAEETFYNSEINNFIENVLEFLTKKELNFDSYPIISIIYVCFVLVAFAIAILISEISIVHIKLFLYLKIIITA